MHFGTITALSSVDCLMKVDEYKKTVLMNFQQIITSELRQEKHKWFIDLIGLDKISQGVRFETK